MINRAAVILKYKTPAVKWVNDADTPDIFNQWIKKNFKAFFENELEGWYTDERLWPKKRNLKLFYEWFEVECHSVIVDTVDLPIEDDERLIP